MVARSSAHGTARSAAMAWDTVAGSPLSRADSTAAAPWRMTGGAPVLARAQANRAVLDSASSASKLRCASAAAVRG